MKKIMVSGVRGGVGTTSVVAMLADALCTYGQTVLMIDLTSSDLLRLHFNVPWRDAHGWCNSQADGGWQRRVFSVRPGLYFLPSGQLRPENPTIIPDDDACAWLEQQCLPHLAHVPWTIDWVIFDCPSVRHPVTTCLRPHVLHDITVVWPDAGVHALLGAYGLAQGSHLLINGVRPERQLSADIVLDWRVRFKQSVLPVWLHEDESVQEAMAWKMPVTRYRPGCAASDAARSLAMWCIGRGNHQP
ncbi:cellulose biosynthesis protein BcsQ [Castellaniella sp.]|uniref:cellulose biosynthesis protein BcsQ n=1 Tax=Castellaniella sp. TaxID=1955812 RepID=UPI003C738BE8